jgi:predicted PurR-regulated permease PerM
MTIEKQLWRRWMLGLGGLVLFLLLVWRLENVSTLILLSFIVAYVLNPLVTRLAGLRFVNRVTATLITMVGLLVALSAVLFIILPQVTAEIRSFAARLPEYADRLQETVIPAVEESFDIVVPLSFDQAFSEYGKDLNNVAGKAIGTTARVAGLVFGRAFSAVLAAVSTLMFPLFLFFLLKDFPRIVETIDGLVPPRNRESVRGMAREIDAGLSAFLHGQFTVMLVLGTLYSIGYSLVGIPVALGIGLLTGILCFIPYVGAATGFVLALLLSLLEAQGIGPVLGVIGVFAGVQILDGVLITPRVLGGKLGLTPIWIVVALMAGGELFGFLGVLLAVPATAVLKVLVSHGVRRYRRSGLFLATNRTGEKDGDSDVQSAAETETTDAQS